MGSLRWLAPVCAAIAIAGCGTTGHQFVQSVSIGDTRSLTFTDCAESAGKTCFIDVTATLTFGQCFANNIVVPEEIALNDRKHNRVVWRLNDGFQFCARAGDGVFMKDAAAPDDLFDPAPHGKCSTEFEWKRKKKDDKDYAYFLRFRSTGGVPCQRDPFIRNG